MSSMGKPFKFQAMEQDMRKNFSRIRFKCETLLAERVKELKDEVDKLVKELEGRHMLEYLG